MPPGTWGLRCHSVQPQIPPAAMKHLLWGSLTGRLGRRIRNRGKDICLFLLSQLFNNLVCDSSGQRPRGLPTPFPPNRSPKLAEARLCLEETHVNLLEASHSQSSRTFPCQPAASPPGGGPCDRLRSDLFLLNRLRTAVGGSSPPQYLSAHLIWLCSHCLSLSLSRILNQALGKKWPVLKK